MSLINTLDRGLSRLCDIVLHVSAFGLFVMSGIIGWQVFARFVLNASPAWTESTALLLMLYYILLAAAVGVREGFHLGVRVVLDSFAPAVRKLVLRLIDVLVGLFGLLMLINGARLAAFTTDHVIPTLDVSRSVAYWPFVICGALIVIFCAERVVSNTPETRRVSPSNS